MIFRDSAHATAPELGEPSLAEEITEGATTRRTLGAIERAAVNEEAREVELSFSSEIPVRDFYYGPPVVLLHEGRSIDMARLRSVAGVTFNHNPSKIVAAIRSASIDEEGRRGRAVIRFDDTDDGERAWKQVKSGSLRGVSVEFVPRKLVKIEEGTEWTSPSGRKFQGPLLIAREWEALGFSLTPIPADRTVGVGRQKEARMRITAQIRNILIARGLVQEGASDEECVRAIERALEQGIDLRLPKEEKPQSGERSAPPAAPPAPPPPASPAAPPGDDEIRRERQRATAVLDIARRARVDDATARQWVEEGISEADATARAFDHLAGREKPVSQPHHVDVVGPSSIEQFQRHAEIALLRRLGHANETIQATEEVDRLTGRTVRPYAERVVADAPRWISLVDIARELIRLRLGRQLPYYLSPVDIVQSREFQHSTSDFANILENVASKTLAIAFQEAPITYLRWTRRVDVRDFKPNKRPKFGEIGNFPEVPELMPLTHTIISEGGESYSIATYGHKFGISRQAIINDDLDVFASVPQKFGDAAARTINRAVYKLLEANPLMAEDGKALFAADHPSGRNLASSTGAPDVTTLGAARTLMRRQSQITDTEDKLNVVPRFLVAPPELETKIDQLMASIVPAQTSNVVPSSVRALEPVIDAELADTTAWYLAADPRSIDTVIVARLQGQQGPEILRQDGSDILGVEWGAFIDFGVKALEHRGVYKNAG